MRATPLLCSAIAFFTACGVSQGPTCSYAGYMANTCSCDIAMPVDLSRQSPLLQLWPFGAHAASGHTEGHRGLDFISVDGTVEVSSPVTGVVRSIDNGQDSSGGLDREYQADPRMRFTTIEADCGVVVKLIPIVVDVGIEAGVRVTKGMKLGRLAELAPPYGPGRWSMHFELNVAPPPDDSALGAVCPADVAGQADRAALTELLTRSTYPEKVARTVTLSCEPSGTQAMTYPAEDQLCNPRVSGEDRARIEACQPSRKGNVW